MDATVTDRPQLTWVEVSAPDGGARLEMRWHTVARAHAAAPAAATSAA